MVWDSREGLAEGWRGQYPATCLAKEFTPDLSAAADALSESCDAARNHHHCRFLPVCKLWWQ